MRGERVRWIASFALALEYLGRRATVLALPHEVVALPGTTDALSLRLFVAKSEAHTRCRAASTSAHGTMGCELQECH